MESLGDILREAHSRKLGKKLSWIWWDPSPSMHDQVTDHATSRDAGCQISEGILTPVHGFRGAYSTPVEIYGDGRKQKRIYRHHGTK
jgi:hypothetical protein